jgi:hypothetical protein
LGSSLCLRAVQKGVEGQDRPRLLPGRDDQRRAVLVRGEDVADRMAHAGGRVQVHEGRVARGLRVAVGHADDHRFLQPEHVAGVGREAEEQRQLGRARLPKTVVMPTERRKASVASRTVT